MEWTTIESDPGVFTELCATVGVKDVAFEELYALDADELRRIEPIYGLIFLFKYRGDEGAQASSVDVDPPKELFFARQVIQNACATQAVLSVLLNAEDRVELGDELQSFLEFSRDFDPETKGMVISNSDVIRNAHNAFARPEPIMMQSRPASEDDDVFHFVAYVPRCGKVYELDGLKQGPINHGEYSDGNWLDVAVPAIQKRISAYSSNEIKFNLMAVTKDPRVSLRQQLDELRELGDDSAAADIDNVRASLEREEAKFEEWRDENIRRRHNYLPLILALVRELAAKNELLPAINRARTLKNQDSH
jgi:ubiquitin carboxyl-terminal hydrolase L5